MTSTVGLVPGAAGGAIGYADLLGEQRRRVVRLAAPTLLGAAAGTALAAVAYAFLATVDWRFAVCLMVSSLVGGRLGAKLARRISGDALRVAIALIGLVVAAALAWRAFG